MLKQRGGLPRRSSPSAPKPARADSTESRYSSLSVFWKSLINPASVSSASSRNPGFKEGPAEMDHRFELEFRIVSANCFRKLVIASSNCSSINWQLCRFQSGSPCRSDIPFSPGGEFLQFKFGHLLRRKSMYSCLDSGVLVIALCLARSSRSNCLMRIWPTILRKRYCWVLANHSSNSLMARASNSGFSVLTQGFDQLSHLAGLVGIGGELLFRPRGRLGARWRPRRPLLCPHPTSEAGPSCP